MVPRVIPRMLEKFVIYPHQGDHIQAHCYCTNSFLDTLGSVFEYGKRRSIMQPLNNVPFESLRIGDRVKSMVTGSEGLIWRLIPVQETRNRGADEIVIKWDTNSISHQWHFWLDKVWLM